MSGCDFLPNDLLFCVIIKFENISSSDHRYLFFFLELNGITPYSAAGRNDNRLGKFRGIRPRMYIDAVAMFDC